MYADYPDPHKYHIYQFEPKRAVYKFSLLQSDYLWTFEYPYNIYLTFNTVCLLNPSQQNRRACYQKF